MHTHTSFVPRLLATAVLTIGATLPLAATAAGGGVGARTHALDAPLYLQAGSMAMSSGATVQRDSGRDVAHRTIALDTPFYLLPDNAPATSGPRARADGRDVAGSTGTLEIAPYLQTNR